MLTPYYKAKVKGILEKSGIPHQKIIVFGLDRIYVSITCKSECSAKRFATILKKSFKNCNISITPTQWEAKSNKELMQHPTVINGFNVGIIYPDTNERV